MIQEELRQIKEKLVEHDKKFEDIDKKFSKVDERFDKVDERFGKVDETLSVIHDCVANKIPALFDGYQSNYQLYKNLQKKTEKLEEQVSLNSIRVSILEDKAKYKPND